MRYILENEAIRAEIDTHGAELKSLKKDGREYMWQADPAFWARTAPVLFPMVGSLKDKTYESHGSTYQLGQHGFARDAEFVLTEQGENLLKFTLASSEETLKKYPYEFSLSITYTLEGASIRTEWSVENPGKEPLYFSIGGHPAFLCEQKGAFFRLLKKDGSPLESLSYELLNGNGTIHKEKHCLDLADGKLPITQELFLKDALVCTESEARQVSLIDPEGCEYLTVDYDPDCSIFGLWSPAGKNAPFVCIEPWYGTADYEDTDGIWEHKKNSRALEPGEVFKRGYTVRV